MHSFRPRYIPSRNNTSLDSSIFGAIGYISQNFAVFRLNVRPSPAMDTCLDSFHLPPRTTISRKTQPFLSLYLQRFQETYYQYILSTLKVLSKKIKPPPALYLQGLKTVFINTFCPITLFSAHYPQTAGITEIKSEYRLLSICYQITF